MNEKSSPDSVIVDPFSKTLFFYYLYLRGKLNVTDLDKIASKYKSKPDKLLTDLQSKYHYFSIPSTVWAGDLLRIINEFSIPTKFRQLLGSPVVFFFISCF